MNRRKKNPNHLYIPPISKKILNPNYENIKVNVLYRKKNEIRYEYKTNVGCLYRKKSHKNQPYFFEIWTYKNIYNPSYDIISIKLNNIKFSKFYFKKFASHIIFNKITTNKTYKTFKEIFKENTEILKLQKH